MINRDIIDVLNFREDISPFLVHLTKDGPIDESPNKQTSKEALEKIIENQELVCAKCLLTRRDKNGNEIGKYNMSVARFGMYTRNMDDEKQRQLFSAISFTETPLNEIQSLIDIKGRNVDLRQYGLVFHKNKLADKGVGPVLYLNNTNKNNKDELIYKLCKILITECDGEHEDVAKELFPMISVFGNQITPYGKNGTKLKNYDFLWEREWRYPYAKGHLKFDRDDLFIGLCPDNEIDKFEELANTCKLKDLKFVDPYRNLKYYAKKLITERKNAGIEASVV